MKWQIRSKFTLALVLLVVIFSAMFLRLNWIARAERARIQSEMIEVQQKIAEHIASNYVTELDLMEQLMIEDDYNIQKIKYEVLDEFLKGLSEEEALKQASAFVKGQKVTLNIYSADKGELIQSFGSSGFYVSANNLGLSSGEEKVGTYKVTTDPIHENLSSKEKSILYYYRSKSQPWLLVTHKTYESQGDQAESRNVLGDNIQGSRRMAYSVMEVNHELKVVRSHSSELRGGQMLSLRPYESGGQKSDGVPLFVFDLLLPSGVQEQWIGASTKTETGQILVATQKKSYDEAYNELSWIMFIVTSVGILFAFAVVLLIQRNYLYFLENEQMGGDGR